MSSRIHAIVLFSLACASGVHATEAATFAVMEQNHHGKALAFKSTYALKKGDVLNVYAFNAQPITVLQVALCEADCSHLRLVKTLPLTAYYAGIASSSQHFVMPQNGYVSFWVERLGGLPSAPLNAPNGTWAVQYVDPFLRFASQTPSASFQPTPANAISMEDSTLRARFDHRTFVTVSLADTGK